LSRNSMGPSPTTTAMSTRFVPHISVELRTSA
jgi:hypothetical protein